MRHLLLASALVLSSQVASAAETILEYGLRVLSPAQQQLAVTAMLSYKIEFIRSDGTRIVSRQDPDVGPVLEALARCDTEIIDNIRDNVVITPYGAARWKAICLENLIIETLPKVRVVLTEVR